MHRTDMHIAIPPRPSPLSQDSTSTLSSSEPSSSASTTSFMPAPGRCTHRPSDRPPTPFPGDCQLCLASEHVGAGAAKNSAGLGALAEEEEEESGDAGPAEHASAQTALSEAGPKEEVATIPPSSRRSSGSSVSSSGFDGASIVSQSGTTACHSSTSLNASEPAPIVKPKQRRISSTTAKRIHARRPSWLRKLLSSDCCDSSSTASKTSSPPSSTRPTPAVGAISPAASTANAAPAQPPQSSQTTTTASGARPARRDGRVQFSATSLMPTVGYSYTLENSVWQAPPVVGPMVKKSAPVLVEKEKRWLVVG